MPGRREWRYSEGSLGVGVNECLRLGQTRNKPRMWVFDIRVRISSGHVYLGLGNNAFLYSSHALALAGLFRIR